MAGQIFIPPEKGAGLQESVTDNEHPSGRLGKRTRVRAIRSATPARRNDLRQAISRQRAPAARARPGNVAGCN